MGDVLGMEPTANGAEAPLSRPLMAPVCRLLDDRVDFYFHFYFHFLIFLPT